MGRRAYTVRGLSLEAREQLRSGLLARAGIASVEFKPLESNTCQVTVQVPDGTGWVPGFEGLCRSLGGEVLPNPRGA